MANPITGFGGGICSPGTGTSGLLPGVHFDLTLSKFASVYSSTGTGTLAGYSIEHVQNVGGVLTISDGSGAAITSGSGMQFTFSDLTEVDPNWDGSAGVVAAMSYTTPTTGRQMMIGVASAGTQSPLTWVNGVQAADLVGSGQIIDLRYNGVWQLRNSGGPSGAYGTIAVQSAAQGAFVGLHSDDSPPQPAFPRLLDSTDNMANNGDQMQTIGNALFDSTTPCRMVYINLDSGTTGGHVTDIWVYDIARLGSNATTLTEA